MPTAARRRPISKRASRTAVSRDRILDAAVEVLVELGYAATSTLEIQRRAGVSRGRLTHHFPSREILLVAAVHHLVETRLERLITVNMQDGIAPDGTSKRIDQAIDLLWRTFHEPYFWAATELWLAARSSRELAQTLLPVERKLYAGIRRSIDDTFGKTFASRPHYLALRAVLFTSMRGVAMTYAFDPRTPDRDPHVAQWREMARRMLTSSRRASMSPSRD